MIWRCTFLVLAGYDSKLLRLRLGMIMRGLLALFALLCSVVSFAAEIKPLPMDKAFVLSAKVKDAQTVVLQWQLAKDYYLYRNRIHVVALKSDKAQLGPLMLPPGVKHYNAAIGNYYALSGLVQVGLPVLQHQGALLGLRVSYQGCSSEGFCYPPTDKVLTLDMTASPGQQFYPIALDVPSKLGGATHSVDQSTWFEQHHLAWILLAFLGYGLLISLTPCVLPMIPILSSIIVGQTGGKPHHWRSFFLSLSYVIGMAITYALIGMLFGILGSNVQTALQTPWVLGLSSLIFVVLALSMFGYYEIQLPSRWQTKLHHSSDRLRRGSYIGVALMGAISSLILSPCVTPPLVGALGFISKTGSALVGAAALFALGLGMGAPLLVIGATSSRFLPKAGPWMARIKQALGVLLLAVAILLLSRIVPAWLNVSLWAALSLGVAIALGAFRRALGRLAITAKFLGILCFIYSVLLMVGLYQGHTNPLRPIVRGQVATSDWKTVTRLDELAAVLARAKVSGQPVLLDFSAKWCIACHQMEQFTFSDAKVHAALQRYVLVRVDITKNDMESKRLKQLYQVIAPPTLVVLAGQSQKVIKRQVGEANAADFLHWLQS